MPHEPRNEIVFVPARHGRAHAHRRLAPGEDVDEVRFETPPAKQAQCDWSELGTIVDNGVELSLPVFVMIMGTRAKHLLHLAPTAGDSICMAAPRPLASGGRASPDLDPRSTTGSGLCGPVTGGSKGHASTE